MPRSFLGSGVALDHPVDYGKMIDLHRAVNPTIMLGMVDHYKDMDKILQFQQDLPGVQIIGRVWHEHEGGYAQKPTGPNDTRAMIATPEDLLEQQIKLGQGSRWLHVMNEPSMFLKSDLLQLTIDWLVKFIRLAAPENCSCVMANLADLHPAIMNGMWDPITWPFLQEMAKHPELMRLGLHFYGPDRITDVITALNETCKYLRIERVTVVGTEFGVDSTGQGDKANGWVNRGWLGEYFLGWEGSTIQGPLKPFIQSGQLVGLDTFEWNALWGGFSIAYNKGYQDAYRAAAAKGELDVEVNSTSIKPKYVPGQIPDTATGGSYYIISYPQGSKVRNLRALPEASSADLGDIREGTLIKLFDLPVEYDIVTQRKWQCCILINQQSGHETGKGWLWTDGIKLTPVKLEDVVKPTPQPTPAPQPDPDPEPPPTPVDPVETPAPVGEPPAPPPETWPTTPAADQVSRWKLTAEIIGTAEEVNLIVSGITKILGGCRDLGLAANASILVIPELVTAEASK